jgi:anthranilate phosphoribosyltransferase
MDELSLSGHSKVSELREGTVNTFYIHPSDVGLSVAPVSALAGGTAAENAEHVTRLLAGESGPRRDVVLLNAGAALLVAGAAETLAAGVERAAESLDSGRARAVLARLMEISAA